MLKYTLKPPCLALTLRVNTDDEQSTTQGEFDRRSCSTVHDRSLLMSTIPTLVLVESMECHSLYQEKDYVPCPTGIAARSESGVESKIAKFVPKSEVPKCCSNSMAISGLCGIRVLPDWDHFCHSF